MMTRDSYTHSGRYTPSGLVKGLMWGTLTGLALAFIYPYIILYIPIVGQVSFIISAGFGAITGLAVGATLKANKVRNKLLANLLAFGVGFVAYAVSWEVWVYAFLRRADADVSLLAMLLSPGAVWELIQEINANGAWTVKNTTPTGGMLWFIWGLEAVIILGAAMFTASALLDDPFCETCELWTKEAKNVAVLGGGESKELKRRLESERLMDVFTQMGAPQESSGHWTRLSMHSCEGCQKLHVLSVHTVTTEKKKEKTDLVVKNLLLTAEEAKGVRELATRFQSAAEAPQATQSA